MSKQREGRPRGRRFRTIMAGTGIAIGAAAASSVAFAAWTTDATGSVSDKAGSVQNLTIVAAPDPKADLFPGKTGAAQFTITNPNPFDVTITSITFGTVTTSAAECAPSNLTPVTKTVTTSIAIKTNSTTAPQSLPNAFTLSKDAPNACQNVVFTISATGTGTQQ